MSAPTPASGLVAVPDAIAADVAVWAHALRAAAGTAFRALYVHGSALAPDFQPQASDVNLLLVVSELSFERLAALAELSDDELLAQGHHHIGMVDKFPFSLNCMICMENNRRILEIFTKLDEQLFICPRR